MEQILGKVQKLFISQSGTSKIQSLSTIEVDLDGIKGSKFYGKNQKRSVLLSSLHAYNLCTRDNIDIAFGELGENILLDFNPHTLAPHCQLSIGTAILELTIPCTLCKGLSTIDPALPVLLEHDRGVFFKVTKPGTISINDSVSIIT
jgi:MOSC domain-containing protein YiiM